MAASPCDVLDTLSQYQLDALTQLNKKLVALQRLAQLLEQLGDAAVAFLNDLQNFVDHLVPVVNIDASLYLQLASACPFLSLPASVGGGGAISTAALQAMVSTAYDNMTRKLLNHPYQRMGALQDQMDSFMNSFAANAALGAGLYQCLQAACNGTLFTGQVSADVNAQIGQYQQNFVVGGGKVLSPAAQAKADQVQALIGKMQDLGAAVGTPYSVAKAKLNALQTATT